MGKIREAETGVEHCLGDKEFSVFVRDSGGEVQRQLELWGRPGLTVYTCKSSLC